MKSKIPEECLIVKKPDKLTFTDQYKMNLIYINLN